MADYVLIKDGIVENIIVADESFIDLIKDQYDAILDHDSFPEIAHVGGQAEQLEDGTWVFGSNPVDIKAVSEDVIDVEAVTPTLAIEAPVSEEGA